jgi:hypothetical protein
MKSHTHTYRARYRRGKQPRFYCSCGRRYWPNRAARTIFGSGDVHVPSDARIFGSP